MASHRTRSDLMRHLDGFVLDDAITGTEIATKERLASWTKAAASSSGADAEPDVDGAFKKWLAEDENAALNDGEVAEWLRRQVKQIKLDVPRTFSSHPLFARKRGRQALERVLVAWVASGGPKEREYCQGMNFLAAVTLVVACGDENAALRLVSHLLRLLEPLYARDMNALKADTARVRADLNSVDEDLARHLFDDLEFDPLTVTPGMFLTLFFTACRPHNSCRVFDAVFAKDSPEAVRNYLVELSVAWLVHRREALLECHDEGSAFLALKRLDSSSFPSSAGSPRKRFRRSNERDT